MSCIRSSPAARLEFLLGIYQRVLLKVLCRVKVQKVFRYYALWDVIENGNSFKPVAQTTTNADGTSTSLIPGPVTTEEKAQKKNDVKARSMLVMELPNEHLIRFGSNEATKKIWFKVAELALCAWRMRRFCRKCLEDQLSMGVVRNAEDLETLDSRNRNSRALDGTINVEENVFQKPMVANEGARRQIPDKSRKGMGFASYNAVPPPLTGLFSPLKIDLSNSILEEFQQPEFEGYGPKPSKSVSEDTSNKVRGSLDAPLIEELMSDEKI
ncbi:hypothetical protein Tco_0134679 [Tanacetum coccineum]